MQGGEIWPCREAQPCNTGANLTIFVLDIDIHLLATMVGRISVARIGRIRGISVGIEEWEVVLAIGMQFLEKWLAFFLVSDTGERQEPSVPACQMYRQCQCGIRR